MIRIRSLVPVTLALMAASQAQAQVAKLERRVLAMGTTLGLELEGPEEALLQKASDQALAEVERIEAAISTWKPDSTFSRLNAAKGKAISLEPEWLALLSGARLQARRTGGAFDPSLAPLVQAWGLRNGGATPSKTNLAEARKASGFELLKLDPDHGTAQLLHPAAGIEEGGFGKGYALDRAAELLMRSGVRSGLLDFGGQFLAFGVPRTVTIADPRDRHRPRLSFTLVRGSLSTSGTSEKGRHILDPRTGRPARAWGAATVVAATGLEADCLSTALFVMGPTRGLRWAARHRVSACFLFNDGQIRMSPAFRALAPQSPKESS